jgi:hypothetical protein
MKKYFPLIGAIVSTTVLCASNALADSAATIFSDPSSTLVTYDNASGAFPVITTIMSLGGGAVVGGHTFNNWAILAQDSTGSIELFGSLPGGYTPTLGDAISVSGTYSPFHQIPEIGTMTSITLESSGNPVPSTLLETIPSLNQATLPQSIAGSHVELDNVTISGASGNFPNANTSYTITDGVNSMVMFFNPTSYSTDAALIGSPIPTGPVNILGLDTVFPTGSIPELIPNMIISVPEPTTLSLCGASALLALALRSRRKA